MTENSASGEVRKEGLTKDEALEIATRKLRERQVRVVARLAPPITTYKVEPRVSQLLGAHYEKFRAGLEEGTKAQAVMDGLERLVYDGAKLSDLAVQGADVIVGGLLVGHGVRGVVTGIDRWKLFGLDLTTAKNYGQYVDEGAGYRTKIGLSSERIRPDRLAGAGKLLAGIGVLRYGPATMVARTALKMTL